MAFPLCPSASKLAGISITRSAVDLPSAPLIRCVTPDLSTTNQLRPPPPLLPQRGGVRMVPYITSDGPEVANGATMFEASGFSFLRSTFLWVPFPLETLHSISPSQRGLCPDGLCGSVSCRHSGCLINRKRLTLPSRPLNNSRLLSGGQHLSKTFFITRRVRVAVRCAGPMIFLADFYNCAVQQNAESPRDASVMTCRRAGARVPADVNHPVDRGIASQARHAQACPRACARTPTHPLARGRARSPTVYTPIDPRLRSEISG